MENVTIPFKGTNYHSHRNHNPDCDILEASTPHLDAIVGHAVAADAKVLLVGDHLQLAAVEAGGAFGLLARRTPAAELAALWRFHHRWEADATRVLRRGDPAALDIYAAHGRLHDGPHEEMVEAAYTAWHADTQAGLDSLLLAADGETVTTLNARARTDRILTGHVASEGIVLRDGTTAGVGDRIITRLNARALTDPTGRHIRNGDTWTVVLIDGSEARRGRVGRGRRCGSGGSRRAGGRCGRSSLRRLGERDGRGGDGREHDGWNGRGTIAAQVDLPRVCCGW